MSESGIILAECAVLKVRRLHVRRIMGLLMTSLITPSYQAVTLITIIDELMILFLFGTESNAVFKINALVSNV